MVSEQGTIVDRIDYNIDKAMAHTVKANKELKEADDYQKKSSKVSCICILILITIVGLLSGLLVWKTK